MAEKNVAIRLSAVGGQAVKQEFVEIGREGSRAFREIYQSSRSGAAGLQNVGYQVQDFAVQVAGGTDASRALAQQLPQLLSGFGLFGVLAGTATAVLVPLIGYLWESGAAVEDLDKQMSELEKSTKAYHEAAQNAATPTEVLIKKFGGQAEVVRELYDAQLSLSRLDLAKKQQDLSAALGESFSTIPAILAQIETVRAAMSNAPDGSELQLINKEALDGLIDNLGMSEEAAMRVRDALDDLGAAKGPTEAAAAMSAVRQSIVDAAGGYEQLTDEQVGLLTKLADAEAAAITFGATDMSGGLRVANAEASTLVERVNAALDRAQRAQDYLKNAKVIGAYQLYADTRSAAPDEPVVHAKVMGGGGGISAAQSEHNKLMDEAKRLFDQTRTAAEKYDIELKKLDEMLSQGAITHDTYNRAVDDLKEKLGGVGEAAKKMKGEIGSALEEIILKGGDARQVIGELLASFASSMFQSGFNSLIGNLFPALANADGNAFDRGNVVPFATGGVVSAPTLFAMRGGLGLMGEAGPEAIMPLRRGSDGKLGVAAAQGDNAGGVAVHVTIDARGAVDGVADQVNEAVQRHIPGIVKQAVAGVGAARSRGYRV